MKIRINKKGQIGDAIDLFMTVSLFIILFLFFSFTFLAVSKAKEQQTSNLVKGVSLNTEVLSNLYYQLYKDEDLSDINIDTIIANTKILGGKVIRSCPDYEEELHCNKDLKMVSIGGCSWVESKCQETGAST